MSVTVLLDVSTTHIQTTSYIYFFKYDSVRVYETMAAAASTEAVIGVEASDEEISNTLRLPLDIIYEMQMKCRLALNFNELKKVSQLTWPQRLLAISEHRIRLQKYCEKQPYSLWNISLTNYIHYQHSFLNIIIPRGTDRSACCEKWSLYFGTSIKLSLDNYQVYIYGITTLDTLLIAATIVMFDGDLEDIDAEN